MINISVEAISVGHHLVIPFSFFIQVEVTDSALLALIENYCREAGVRNLQKQIEKIYRKVLLQFINYQCISIRSFKRVYYC